MGLFANKLAEVDIEFYGQKKRKVISSTPLEFHVEMTPELHDPETLGEFYFKFIIGSSERLLLAARPLLWDILNAQLKNIHKDANMMFTWEQLVDVPPTMTEVKKKKCSFIKGTLNDNGKVKYKISDDSQGGLEMYYVPIGAMAFLQYIIDTLSEEELSVFYQKLSDLIIEKRSSLKPNQQHVFNVEPLPPYNQH